jgi:hypothetical protein
VATSSTFPPEIEFSLDWIVNAADAANSFGSGSMSVFSGM